MRRNKEELIVHNKLHSIHTVIYHVARYGNIYKGKKRAN